jgi:hypothetical protein
MTAQCRAKNMTAAGVVLATASTFRGLTLSSVAGATVNIYDNASAASGTVLASVIIGANGSAHIDIADGVRCENGIYLDTAGTVVGSVRYG